MGEVRITDEMVEAARAKGRELAGNQPGALVEAMAEIAEQGARAALSAALSGMAEPVKVKPLDWVDDETRPDTSWQANTFWGHYRIFQVWWGAQDKWGFCCADTAEQLFHTLDAAKAAAQADYEHRILSALQTEGK